MLQVVRTIALVVATVPAFAGYADLAVTAAGTTILESSGATWGPEVLGGLTVTYTGSGGIFTSTANLGLTHTQFTCTSACQPGFVFTVLGATATFPWSPTNPLVLHFGGTHNATSVTANYAVATTPGAPVPNPLGTVTLSPDFNIDSDPIYLTGPATAPYNLSITVSFGAQTSGFSLELPSSFEVRATPEPATWALFGGAFGILWTLRRVGSK